MDTHVWPICLYSLTHIFIHSCIHWFIYINKHHNEEPLRPKNRSPICPKLYPLKGKKPTLFLKQDEVSELHCLLTGQCCLLAQTDSGILVKGMLTFEHLEVDFPEMKPHRHYHYLLVMVCTFSGWVEAFPTGNERTSEVAWCLLREIVSRFGFPTSIGSNNGPAFIADLV